MLVVVNGGSKVDDSKLAQLLHWISRGWALVPLHNVSSGVCSCWLGTDCGDNAGKHPIRKAWHDRDQLVATAEELEATHLAHPEWNWGMATGQPSGVWVLDWDVKHDAEIRAWLTEHVGDWRPDVRPDLGTLTLGPTGGGGWHYVFALPADFVPRGSQTRNRYGLPPGLDVRGVGGQIVVAPSVSGKGPYGGVLLDRPVGRAPAWLENRLRPAPESSFRARNEDQEARALVSQSYNSSREPRAWAYARAAVEGLLRELAGAPDGTRDDTTIRTACRLVELANASWSGFSEAQLYDAWVEARMLAADRASVERELPGKWARAVGLVGGKAAELPPSYVGAEAVPLLDFVPAPTANGAAPGALAWGEPGEAAPSYAPGPAPGGQQVGRPTPTGFADAVELLRSQLLTAEQLRQLPPPRPLIEGILDRATCAWLIGKPGSCKSFVALDFAVHVGLGLPWQGRRVHQGRVVYIVAEGSTGMSLRVAAIEREYGEIKEVLFLPLPIGADERRSPGAGPWSVLVEVCRLEAPALVVIDTQARVTIGLNENDNGDMSYFAEQADRIKRATGATVLVIHHLGRVGTNARGASAIDGAQDTELRVERPHEAAMALTLHTDKQKDQAAAAPVQLALRLSEGGQDPETGRDLSSLVVVRLADLRPGELPMEEPGMAPPVWMLRMIELYQLIRDRYNAGAGGTEAEIKAAFEALPAVAPLSRDGRRKAFNRAWNGTETAPGLIPRGLIAQRAGAARFKVVVLADQSEEGVLTPNDLRNPTLPPEGWNLYLPDNAPPEA